MAIKDVLGIKFDIKGAEDIDIKEKYLFVEDQHAMGDLDMLESEAVKKENITNIITFISAFTLISLITIMCCYFNYKFSTAVAQRVFFIYVVAWLLDFLLFRLLMILFMAMIRFCKARKQGYEKIDYLATKDVQVMISMAVKDMFRTKRPPRGGDTPGETPGEPPVEESKDGALAASPSPLTKILGNRKKDDLPPEELKEGDN
jgi:hypothetical protein